MNSTTDVIAGVGLADAGAKSRWPARLDWLQSASGLVLALFMWGHMFFVSTILISNDAMWTVTKAFEGYFVFGRSYPGLVSIVVAGVTTSAPVTARAPDHAPEDVQEVESVDDHANVLLAPAVMEFGVADIDTVGSEALPVTMSLPVTVADARLLVHVIE